MLRAALHSVQTTAFTTVSPQPQTHPRLLHASAEARMRIAVVGCSHGTLDDIYASVERCDVEARKKGEPEVDLMICCGDFQVSAEGYGCSHAGRGRR